MAKHKLLIIEESTLISMANTQAFLAEFPFLAMMQKARGSGGCGGCGRSRTRNAAAGKIKRTIIGLASDKKQRLKQMLSAKQLRLRYLNDKGAPVTVTF